MSEKVEIHCVFCSELNKVKLKMDGSSIKPCTSCGGNPLPMDSLLVQLNLGEEDFRICPKCETKDCMHKFCWNCGHGF